MVIEDGYMDSKWAETEQLKTGLTDNNTYLTCSFD